MPHLVTAVIKRRRLEVEFGGHGGVPSASGVGPRLAPTTNGGNESSGGYR